MKRDTEIEIITVTSIEQEFENQRDLYMKKMFNNFILLEEIFNFTILVGLSKKQLNQHFHTNVGKYVRFIVVDFVFEILISL